MLPKIVQLSNFDPVSDQVSLLRATKPAVFSGFSVSIEKIAHEIINTGVSDIHPKVVYVGGMEVSETTKSLARKAFETKVVNIYATNEVGALGWEAPDIANCSSKAFTPHNFS